MHRVFQSFIDGLADSTDATDLQNVLAHAGGGLDLSCFGYLSLPSRRSDRPQLISTYPTKWTDHYLKQRYERVDSVIGEALATPVFSEWEYEFSSRPLPKAQQALLDEAAQFGIRCGFTVPSPRSARSDRSGNVRGGRTPRCLPARLGAQQARPPAHGDVLSCTRAAEAYTGSRRRWCCLVPA